MVDHGIRNIIEILRRISPVASPPSRPSKHGPLHQWTQCSPHHDSTAGFMKFSINFIASFYHPLSPPTGQTNSSNSSFPVDPTHQPTNPRVIHPTHRFPSAWPRSRCESFHGVPWPWPSPRWPIRCPPRGWRFPPWGLGLWKRQTLPGCFFFHIKRRQLEKENNETPLEKELRKKKTLRKGFINLY